MNPESYPALFRSADNTANKKQSLYLALICSEYVVLLIAATLTMNVFTDRIFYLVYAVVFLTSIILLLVRTVKKPEQDWYECRALAESVKTLTWRYMMRAAPFGDNLQGQLPRAEFRNQLHQVFDENRGADRPKLPFWKSDAGDCQYSGHGICSNSEDQPVSFLAAVKSKLRERMQKSTAVILLVGKKTKNLHKFITWELDLALELGLPIIVANLNDKRELDAELCPAIIRNACAVHVPFKAAAIGSASVVWPAEFRRLPTSEKQNGARTYSVDVYKGWGL
jgi:hypothetical protein